MALNLRSRAVPAVLVGMLALIAAGCGGTGVGMPAAPPPTAAATAAAAAPTSAPAAAAETLTPNTAAAPAAVPAAEVLAAIAAARGIKVLPADLMPTLKDATKDAGNVLAESQGCFPQYSEVEVGDCVWGDPAGSRTVVLVGDSHAAMWLTAFDQIGLRKHWKVVLLSKVSCPPPYRTFYNKNSPYPECDKWHDYVIERINKANPDLVVLTSNTVTPGDSEKNKGAREGWAASLTKTLSLITAPKAKKVVLGDMPRLGSAGKLLSGPECLAAHQDDIQACSAPKQTVLDVFFNGPGTIGGVEKEATEKAGATFIDPFPWFCSDTCTGVVGNMLVYRDPGHITATYANFVSGMLEESLQAAMGA